MKSYDKKTKLCIKTVKILKQLQHDDPAKGYGHPKLLKHTLSGLWSRKISKKDRLIYNFTETAIHIFAMGGHYGDK